MRLWSIHPKYLDTKGLVALWREALLAKHVLENKTKGYRNHSQLRRFKEHAQPLHAINYYLSIILEEAGKKGYRFDPEKIDWNFSPVKISVTAGQVDYEMEHLEKKLQTRDPEKLKEVLDLRTFETHPAFAMVQGGVEEWEIVSGNSPASANTAKKKHSKS